MNTVGYKLLLTMGASLMLLLSQQGTLVAQNLAVNPSFESGSSTPDGWEVGNWMPDHIQMGRVTNVSRSGQASVGINSDSVGAAEYPSYKFSLSNPGTGREYQGSVWAKTENMGGLGGYIVLEFFNGGTRLSLQQGDSTGTGTKDWMKLTVRGVIPAGANIVKLTLVAHGEGQVWFDDADLRIVNLITNPSFESGTTSPTGWEVGNWLPAHIQMQRVTDVARTGQASARIVCDPQGAQEYPAYKFQVSGVQAGDVFFGSAWMKTQGMIGLGGYVVIEFFSGDTRLSFAHDGRFSGEGDKDWLQLTVEGTVPTGTTHIKLGLVVHGQGTIWFDDAVFYLKQAASAPFEGDEVNLKVRPDQVIREPFLGFGAQGDYFLTASPNLSRGISNTDRQFVERRIAASRPDIMRVFFDYRWWEFTEGRQTPSNEFIRDLVYWFGFLKGINCQINLTPWGDWWAYPTWMRDGEKRLPKADKRDEMVRSLVDFVWYLRRDLQLTNVRYLTLMNEPDNNPLTKPTVDEFIAVYRMLDQELKDRGLRNEIFLIGVDGSGWGSAAPGEWYYEVVSRGLDYCDGAASHTYGYNLDMTSRSVSFDEWVGSRLSLLDSQAPSGQSRKPWIIAEYNVYGDTFSNPHNGKYDHGLFLVDFALRALNKGADAILMWCLFDTYYTNDLKQEYGLWRYKFGADANTNPSYTWETWDPSWVAWEPRPGFYSYSLLTRYTEPGSKVLKIEVSPQADSLAASALVTPAGEVTILIVNRYGRPLTITLDHGLNRSAQLGKYVYSTSAIPTADREMITRGENLPAESGVPLEINIPATSFTVLTEVPDTTSVGSWCTY